LGFFKEQKEIDILLLLGKMEKEGMQIDNNIDAKFR